MPTKILAIDDSKTMRLAIKITFAAEQADVTSVSKGSEAVARAKQMGADVVLVDASLAPGEPSGYDVCRALKQEPATASIPVIVLVSNQTGVDQAQLASCGAEDWLAKPFDTQELIDKVAAVLGKSAGGPAKVVSGPVAAPPPPRVAAEAPRVAVAAEADASQSGSSRRRPENRTQTGMPSPTVAPTPRPSTVSTPPAAARAPLGKPSISPASLASKPAAPAPAPAVAAAPAPRPAKPIAASKPAVAARATPAATGLSRPAVASDGPIPIAIPIPFTAADAPTAGMVERLRQAATVGNIDPKVAEVIASLSREVLEAIAWEVVPDLAESIIREKVRTA